LLPFDDPISAFRDIAEAIRSIEQFTEGMDFEAFRSDLKTIAAVERKLLVISEAALRLKERVAILCPGPPWAEIAASATGCGISTTASIWKCCGTLCMTTCRRYVCRLGGS
jgi:hypothetical protein